MTSKITSWRQDIRRIKYLRTFKNIWHKSIPCCEKYVVMSKSTRWHTKLCKTSLRSKVHHIFKMYTITSKGMIVYKCLKFDVTSRSMSLHKHDVNKYVMMSKSIVLCHKLRHDKNRYVITSKKYIMPSRSRSLRQKGIMTLQSMPLRNKLRRYVQTNVMTSKSTS